MDVRDEVARPAIGPSAATILATEHWSLLGTRAMAWNEAMSRATVFLTVLSAAIVALALVADATSFRPPFATFALVLLPAVLFLGLATYTRLVQINNEDTYLVQAMNRLRRAYLDMEPGLERYFSASAHDDPAGILATLTLGEPLLPRWIHLWVTTPTIVATLDAVLAAAIAALAALQLDAALATLVVAPAVAFAAVLLGLFWLEARALASLGHQLTARFPTPSDDPSSVVLSRWWGRGRSLRR